MKDVNFVEVHMEKGPPKRSLWRKFKTSEAAVHIADGLFDFINQFEIRHRPKRERQINENYKYNRQFEFSGYLNGQGVGDLAKLRFGKKTFSKAGCGPIATYNAMLVLGKHISIQDIVRGYERYGLMGGGTFGTSPIAIEEFFRCKGYSAKTFYGSDAPLNTEYDMLFDDNTAAIFTFYNGKHLKKGAHYVTAAHNAEGGIDVYNWNCHAETAVSFDSIYSMIKARKNMVPLSITVVK